MVRTHIGVLWPGIPPNPLTGTIAYEVKCKAAIPGPCEYPAPRLEGPHGGKFNASKTKRLIEHLVYEGGRLPGPGQYNGSFEPVDVPLPGYTPIAERKRGNSSRKRWSHSPDRLQLSPAMTPASRSRSSLDHLDTRGPRSGAILPIIPRAGHAEPGQLVRRSGAQSVDPAMMMHKRVSFSHKAGQHENLAEMIAQGLATHNGYANFTGGHQAPAGVNALRHSIVTPRGFKKERTVWGNTRRFSNMTEFTIASTVHGGAASRAILGSRQAEHGGHYDGDELQSRDVPSEAGTRENTARTERSLHGLSKTSNKLRDDYLHTSYVDGRVLRMTNHQDSPTRIWPTDVNSWG
mmetsp:Transcript_2472/g.5954  ORF Transcript_2472/g.5954 Transcript_2472/m.5954 type:complete len:348 (-) Transcript_2472:148-1191(-)